MCLMNLIMYTKIAEKYLSSCLLWWWLSTGIIKKLWLSLYLKLLLFEFSWTLFRLVVGKERKFVFKKLNKVKMKLFFEDDNYLLISS